MLAPTLVTRMMATQLTTMAFCAALLSLALLIAREADAASPSFRTSLERQLLDDARDGYLDEFSFLDASLIASGVAQTQQLAECRAMFSRHSERFRALNPRVVDQRTLAAAALAFLHQEILTAEYQITSTRVDQALATGNYNCVASTILFRCLSAEVGVAPVVVATPSHVFCRYPGPDRVDVETTCAEWFALPSPGDRVAEHPAHQATAEVRVLSDVEVLGKVFYNRATDQLDRQEFAAACELLRTSLALDSADAAARENLLAAINNWSLQRCEAEDFAHAAQLLTEGIAISPDYLPIQMNDLHVHQQWALDLCQRQHFAEALRLLERGYERRPTAELFDQGRFAVSGLWADALFSQGKDAEALICWDDARRRHPTRPEVAEREAASLLRAVQERIARGQTTAAHELLEVGLSRQPDNLLLKTKARDLTNAKS